jgi:hypothetical protein
MAKELKSDNSLLLNIRVKRNDSFYTFFTLYEDGQPFDFTGCSARMQVKDSDASDDVVLEILSADSEIILGDDSGVVTFDVPFSKMDMDAKTYVYDLEITKPDTRVETVVYGSFIVTSDTTR